MIVKHDSMEVIMVTTGGMKMATNGKQWFQSHGYGLYLFPYCYLLLLIVAYCYLLVVCMWQSWLLIHSKESYYGGFE